MGWEPMLKFDAEAYRQEQRRNKIQHALEAFPHCTTGDWWCDNGGEMHNNAIGSCKLAKYVSGYNAEEAKHNRVLLSAAKELAEEVIRLRQLLRLQVCNTKMPMQLPVWKAATSERDAFEVTCGDDIGTTSYDGDCP